jgi:hypothetical protein
MSEFIWKGNAEAIYEAAISATPRLFRHHTRSGLDHLLSERWGAGPITEMSIVITIIDNTPKLFLGRGIEAIKPHITDKRVLKYV